MYSDLLIKNPESKEIIKDHLSDLSGMIEYIQEKEHNKTKSFVGELKSNINNDISKYKDNSLKKEHNAKDIEER